MYADSAVKDIYDVISDDTIDLNRFACMCDSFGLFYSEDSTAAVLSSKISENQDLPNKHNHTQTLPHIDLCHHNTPPSKAGTRCGVDCALDAGGTSPKSGPEGGRIDEAEKQLFEQGPYSPTTTPQAAPNPILSGCGVDTNESEGIHINGGHITVDRDHNILHNIRNGDSSPLIPHSCKAPASGSVGTHPSPDGPNTSTNVKADVAPRGSGVFITHANSLANSLKGGLYDWQ